MMPDSRIRCKRVSVREYKNMRYLRHAIAMTALMLATAGAMADEPDLMGCDNGDPDHRIPLCTALIEAPATNGAVRARAYFLRGVANAQLGQFQRAVRDYGEAIRLNPRYGIAFNNRADAWLRLGDPAQGKPDIEKALEINSQDALYNTTHGEIVQSLGDAEGAMRSHETALSLGGVPFIKFYQCGLRLARLYHGPLDGVITPELRTALRQCVDKGIRCDPVLPFLTSECPEPVS
jgi:tetratricopeptide (TPR) repeat protein